MPGNAASSTWRMCRTVAALARIEDTMNGGLLL
jgi:hypothetical protein